MEIRETQILSPYAMLSIHSRGREEPEEECDIPAGISKRQGPDPSLQGIPQT